MSTTYGTVPAQLQEADIREIRVTRGSHDGKEKGANEFCTNYVSTAKYTAISFLPMSLFEQFRRVANFYFLCISILMLIGTYTTLFDSPYEPWSTIAVLSVVVMISVVKGGLEDLKRHEADRVTNRKLVDRLIPHESPGFAAIQEFDQIEWRRVRVGDILRISMNTEIPADLVLLTTSEEGGSAYVETSNIDGEANLKIKNSARTSKHGSMWSDPADLRSVDMTIHCEAPNSAINQFSGTLYVGDQEVPLDASNLLLRSSTLRNTRWAVGVVVYTGRETKIVMNSRGAPFKLSSIERTMNNILLVVLAGLFIISGISLAFYIVWTNTYYDDLDYLCFNYENSGNEVYETDCSSSDNYSDVGYFFTFFILYSNFLPISLYVTVEICNFYQAYYIDYDLQMYDEGSDTPAVARTSNMNADLGMVEYIFSDKTGTLTDNIMKFRRCSVAGVVYGQSPGDEDGHAVHKKKSVAGLSLATLSSEVYDIGTPASEFVAIMALCHTVVLDDESGDFLCESPDEDALVKAAAELGWVFAGRKPGKVIVRLRHPDGDREFSYTLLATIPFDSTRKRMSVVLKKPDGKIVMYTKGADNVIFERATGFQGGASPSHEVRKQEMESHLDVFATDGLRTLVFAKREISKEVFDQFKAIWSRAERALAGREEIMVEAAAILERDLVVVGASAIEDKLQDGVPETIVDLRNAGVKLWVLTGDKVETAINIGYSARLLTNEMVLIRLQDRGQDAAALKRQMVALVNIFKRLAGDKEDRNRIWRKLQARITSIIYGTGESKKKKDSSNAGAQPEASEETPRDQASSSTSLRQRRGRSGSKGLTDADIGNKGGKTVDDSDSDNNLTDDEDGDGERNYEKYKDILESQSLLDKPDDVEGELELSQLTSDHLALIVDGDTLLKIFGDKQLEKLFLQLGRICRSVIACRVSPEQKRLVVRLVKRGVESRPVTLSIGDGANDVAMIQEANIGVGLSGKEGRQAVNSSDFAIARFRFLKRLMLLHGRYDYRRVCKVILFSFYKNIVLTFILFAYTFNSGYSGQSLFDDYVHSAYNIILAFPVIAFGIYDKDLSESMVQKYSLLYVVGRKRQDLNIRILLGEMLQAGLDTLIIFGISYYCSIEPGDIWGKNAYNDGIWIFGTTVYTALVIAMFVRIFMLTQTWNIYSHLFYWFSIALYIIFLAFYEFFIDISYNFYGTSYEMSVLPAVWLIIVVIPSASGLLDLFFRMVQREFFPTVADVAAEVENHESEFMDLLPTPATGPSPGSSSNPTSPLHSEHGDTPAAKALVEEGEEQPLDDTAARQEVQSDLRFSRVFGGDNVLPLDWASLQNMVDSLQPQEMQKLGMQNTEDGPAESSFNFDHVASGSLHYLSSALSAPLVFVSSSLGGNNVPAPAPASERNTSS